MPRFFRFAIRDLGILAVTAGAWWLDARERGRHSRAEVATGVAAGLLTATAGFLAHEWGHLAAAIGSGGVVHEPPSIASLFLFSFDVGASDRRSFLAMSLGGYAGTVIAASAIAALAPRGTLGRKVAITAAILGGASTFAFELPTTIRVARGGPIPSGGVFTGEPGSGA